MRMKCGSNTKPVLWNGMVFFFHVLIRFFGWDDFRKVHKGFVFLVIRWVRFGNHLIHFIVPFLCFMTTTAATDYCCHCFRNLPIGVLYDCVGTDRGLPWSVTVHIKVRRGNLPMVKLCDDDKKMNWTMFFPCCKIEHRFFYVEKLNIALSMVQNWTLRCSCCRITLKPNFSGVHPWRRLKLISSISWSKPVTLRWLYNLLSVTCRCCSFDVIINVRLCHSMEQPRSMDCKVNRTGKSCGLA